MNPLIEKKKNEGKKISPSPLRLSSTLSTLPFPPPSPPPVYFGALLNVSRG